MVLLPVCGLGADVAREVAVGAMFLNVIMHWTFSPAKTAGVVYSTETLTFDMLLARDGHQVLAWPHRRCMSYGCGEPTALMRYLT